MKVDTADLQAFAARAGEVADILKLLGNRARLMILCTLAELGTASVGDLAEAIGLSQSATSQHLAKLRAEDIVSFHRDGQTLWYEVTDPRLGRLLDSLHAIYCEDIT